MSSSACNDWTSPPELGSAPAKGMPAMDTTAAPATTPAPIFRKLLREELETFFCLSSPSAIRDKEAKFGYTFSTRS